MDAGDRAGLFHRKCLALENLTLSDSHLSLNAAQRMMVKDHIAPPPSSIFGREEELASLRSRLAARQSLLLHGPAGAGKSLLLAQLLPQFPDALYSGDNLTAQALYRNLAEGLFSTGDRVFRATCPSRGAMATKSAVALRGIVRDTLRDSKYLIVLDHLMRPSQSLAASVRELKVSCALPVIAVSRSDHMEDAGFVLSLYSERREKFALQNLDPETALEFAGWCVERECLTAENLGDFKQRIVEYTRGNPGAMERMVRMAKEAKYRHNGQIKVTPLYIDYKITMVSRGR
jgi:hypothetical protein